MLQHGVRVEENGNGIHTFATRATELQDVVLLVEHDEYALLSQQRTAQAQASGIFDNEIVSLKTTMKVVDKESGDESLVEVTATSDECNRPETTLEKLAGLNPVHKDGQQVKEGRYITAGNASQMSDGASVCMLMKASEAERQVVGHAQQLAKEDSLPWHAAAVAYIVAKEQSGNAFCVRVQAGRVS